MNLQRRCHSHVLPPNPFLRVSGKQSSKRMSTRVEGHRLLSAGRELKPGFKVTASKGTVAESKGVIVSGLRLTEQHEQGSLCKFVKNLVP